LVKGRSRGSLTASILVAVVASAGPVLAGQEKKPLSLDRIDERQRAILIVECWDGLNDRMRALLAYSRMNGVLPPFSQVWCIKNGVVPPEMRKNGEAN
jgi:hypothetical protein